MKINLNKICLLIAFAMTTLVVSGTDGFSATTSFTVEDLGTITSKECEKTCSQCTERCCTCGQCSSIKSSCTIVKKKKYSISPSFNFSIWGVQLNINSGWETEEVSTSGGELNCTTCTKLWLWEGFKEHSTKHNRFIDDKYKDSVTKKEKTIAGDSGADDC